MCSMWRPLGSWRSPHTGIRYPSSWRVRVPRLGLDVVVRPTIEDQEVTDPFAVLGAFGRSRVMFGSDWPVCPPAASYQELVRTTEELTSGLNAVERAEVFGGTAARAYRLPLDRPREEAP